MHFINAMANQIFIALLVIFGFISFTHSMTDEQIIANFGPQIEKMLKPCVKLACCNDPNVEKDARAALACIKDQVIIKKVNDKFDQYKKDKNKYCDKKGHPIQKAVDDAIHKESSALLKEGDLKRYIPAICMKKKAEDLLVKYKKACDIP